MGIESGSGVPAAESAKQHEAKMERERQIKAKMEGIKGNPGESRSDAEIRAQAEFELRFELEGDPSRTEPPTEAEIQKKAEDIIKSFSRQKPDGQVAIDRFGLASFANELAEEMGDNSAAAFYPFYRKEDFKDLAQRVNSLADDQGMVHTLYKQKLEEAE